MSIMLRTSLCFMLIVNEYKHRALNINSYALILMATLCSMPIVNEYLDFFNPYVRAVDTF